MKEQLIFADVALVEIQGDRVLRFVDMTQERARYQVIGFDDLPITVLDYRSAGLRAIKEILTTSNLHQFAPQFNVPSQVEIFSLDSLGLRITLHEAEATTPAYTLWIAIGMDDRVPVYDYILEQMEPLEDGRFAFLALYRRPVRLAESPLSALSAAI